MSGYTKERIYQVCSLLLFAAALCGIICMVYFFLRDRTIAAADWILLVLFLLSLFLLPLHTLLHELGHLLLGAIVRMGFSSVVVGHFGFFRFGRRFRILGRIAHAGASEMYPRGAEHMRGRFLLYLLGGAGTELLFGVLFLVLYFLLPPSHALMFFALYAPLCLYEGIMALLPVQLSAGKTDGYLLAALLFRRADGEALLAVMRAGGMLYRGTFETLPPALLQDVPAIPASDPCFFMLLRLRWQYAYAVGDRIHAAAELNRMSRLFEDLPSEAREEALCDLVWAQKKGLLVQGEQTYALPELAERENASVEYLRALAACAGQEDREQILRAAAQKIKRIPLLGIRRFEQELIFGTMG